MLRDKKMRFSAWQNPHFFERLSLFPKKPGTDLSQLDDVWFQGIQNYLNVIFCMDIQVDRFG